MTTREKLATSSWEAEIEKVLDLFDDQTWRVGREARLNAIVCMAQEEARREAIAELDALKERTRRATQRIIEAIGSNGPENLEDALGRLLAERDALKVDNKRLEGWLARSYDEGDLMSKQRDKAESERDAKPSPSDVAKVREALNRALLGYLNGAAFEDVREALRLLDVK